jgi:hypothetical protein
MLQRRVAGFPKIGHDDTWLVDLSQKHVLHNHRTLFCPSWLNSSEVRNTTERKGATALHSNELGDAIDQRGHQLRQEEEEDLKDEAPRFESKYSMDLHFRYEKTCLILPILPFHCRREDRLILEQIRKRGAFDEE